jgi:hypothetical protein
LGGSVGRHRAAAAGLGRGDALDFGQRNAASFGNALFVNRRATTDIAHPAFDPAGLPQPGVDPRFKRSAPFSTGKVDIVIRHAQGHDLISRQSERRGGGGGEGNQGKNKTHYTTPHLRGYLKQRCRLSAFGCSLQLWCSAQEQCANAKSARKVPKNATDERLIFGNHLIYRTKNLLRRKNADRAAALLDSARHAA